MKWLWICSDEKIGTPSMIPLSSVERFVSGGDGLVLAIIKGSSYVLLDFDNLSELEDRIEIVKPDRP